MASFSKTGVSYLVRRSCGTYYWHAKLAGVSRRGTLRTKKLPTAKARLSIELSKAREKWERKGGFSKGGELVTIGDWLREWKRRQNARPRLKQLTKDHDSKLIDLLLREAWVDYDVRRVPAGVMDEWWRVFCDRCEPDTVNSRLRVLKASMKIARAEGAMVVCPVSHLERQKKIRRVIEMPSFEELQMVIESIRAQDKVFSQECADMVECGAFTGLRPKELASIRGEDIRAGYLIVRGDGSGTKNREEREVPIVSDLAPLIDCRRWKDKEGLVFSIKTPARALGNACARVGVPHLTPYDLRHFFITSCIESGVDVPTVALWAGHKDGGALIMSTYAHVRRRHSMEQAARVRF
jgi:integrase